MLWSSFKTGRTGIKHVALSLFSFELNGIEQDAVELLEHRQHRFARHRGPAAEHNRDLVLADQLAGLFRKERPVRCRINHHRLEFLAEEAALLVLGRSEE